MNLAVAEPCAPETKALQSTQTFSTKMSLTLLLDNSEVLRRSAIAPDQPEHANSNGADTTTSSKFPLNTGPTNRSHSQYRSMVPMHPWYIDHTSHGPMEAHILSVNSTCRLSLDENAVFARGWASLPTEVRYIIYGELASKQNVITSKWIRETALPNLMPLLRWAKHINPLGEIERFLHGTYKTARWVELKVEWPCLVPLYGPFPRVIRYPPLRHREGIQKYRVRLSLHCEDWIALKAGISNLHGLKSAHFQLRICLIARYLFDTSSWYYRSPQSPSHLEQRGKMEFKKFLARVFPVSDATSAVPSRMVIPCVGAIKWVGKIYFKTKHGEDTEGASQRLEAYVREELANRIVFQKPQERGNS